MKKGIFLTVWLVAPIVLLSQRLSNEEYIAMFKNIAMEQMRQHKIPASITLAQGILESGSGNSRLSTQGNNHFGIKCKKNWTGSTIIEDDDEKNECFRAYSNARESYEDHAQFLRENQRYAFLFEYSILDYTSWAEGLRKAGYATNPRYPQLLISLIERLNLAQYDSIVFYNPDGIQLYQEPLQQHAMPQLVDNGVPAVIARKGQTAKSIADGHNMRDWQIYKYNDLPKGAAIEPGMVVYLKPKRNRASVEHHTVQEGQSMWEISQIYGVKLKKLYKKNRMQEGGQPEIGQTLHMQKKVKAGASIPTSIHIKGPAETPEPVGQSEVTEQPIKGFIIHRIQKGETLYSISRMYGVSVEEIKSWNQMTSNDLRSGEVLKVIHRN
jgi:LysM repeat protein